MWHHFPTVLPPDGSTVNLRRIPEGTDTLVGTFDATSAIFNLARAGWVLPWELVAAWTERPSTANTLPTLTAPTNAALFRDVYTFPPAKGQTCWIRRYPLFLPMLRGVWNQNDDLNFVLDIGWPLPWFFLTSWKPAT